MISDLVASEMGKILKIANEKDDKESAHTCSLKLWCCHPTDSRAECIGTVNFDEVSEGQDAFFSPEEHFDEETLKKAEYIELVCEDEEEPVVRKNPSYDEKEGHAEHGNLEVVLITDEANCSGCYDGNMQSLSNLMGIVAKIATLLEKKNHPLYRKADNVLSYAHYLLKESTDHRDLSALLRDGFSEDPETDCKKREISIPIEYEETEDVTDVVELPLGYAICNVCEGHGKHVHPNIERHGITSSELEEMSVEGQEACLGGAYDVTCKKCRGTGKKVVIDVSKLNKEQLEAYKKNRKGYE